MTSCALASTDMFNPRRTQSFYYDEKPLLSNEEFDNLKEELLWEGSKVAVLRCAPYCQNWK